MVVGVEMVDKLLQAQVSLFLTNFKDCASKGKVDFSEVNVKTTRFLRSIGWTVRAMNNYVLNNIESKHYFRGPTDHHRKYERTVTEFGMTLVVEGEIHKMYIKLELIIQNEEFISGYMSFHPREKEILNFPLDEKGEVI